MDINYDWNFNPLESYPTASGETDVVFMVHWQLYATTGSYKASNIGTQVVIYESGSSFVPFNELTKEIVQTWIVSSMGETRINQMTASLEQNILNQINPPILVQQAPWL